MSIKPVYRCVLRSRHLLNAYVVISLVRLIAAHWPVPNYMHVNDCEQLAHSRYIKLEQHKSHKIGLQILLTKVISHYYASVKNTQAKAIDVGESIMYAGCPSGCLSVSCPSVNAYSRPRCLFTQRRDFNETNYHNIHHSNGHCWKGFQGRGQRSRSYDML